MLVLGILNYMPNLNLRSPIPMWCIGWVLLLLGAATSVRAAESLMAVLEHVHQNHPRLQASRNNLLAVHEQVPSALAAFLPRVSVSAELGRTSYEREYFSDVILCRNIGSSEILANFGRSITPDQETACINSNGQVEQAGDSKIETFYGENAKTNPSYIRRSATGRLNLFRSGADLAQYRSAHHLVDRQEALYRNVEQEILLQGIQAYLQVHLARRTIGYRESNLEALRERARVTRNQFEIQDKTLADLEQVRARVAVALADLALAKAAAAQAEATFLRVVGRMPGETLAEVESASDIPPSLEQAVGVAQTANPRVRTARAAWMSANAQARRTLAANGGPTVDFVSQISENHSREKLVGDTTQWSMAFQLSVPIYQGGAVGAAVRQARHSAEQSRSEYLDEVRATRESVTRAWEDYLASKARKDALEEAARAAQVALATVRLEVEVGQRLVVDELDAARDLVNNQVTLEQASRDWLLAGYQLRRHTGALTASSLGLADHMPQRKGFTADMLAPTPYQLWRHRGVYRGAE